MRDAKALQLVAEGGGRDVPGSQMEKMKHTPYTNAHREVTTARHFKSGIGDPAA